MNILLNIIWFIFGGIMIALEYVCSSLLMMLTIVGIPFGIQTFKLAALSLFPFGKRVVESPASMGGCLNSLMNIIWWIVGGIPIALTHLGWGLLFSITIVGLPFGIQHFKLMRLALFPFGKQVV